MSLPSVYCCGVGSDIASHFVQQLISQQACCEIFTFARSSNLPLSGETHLPITHHQTDYTAESLNRCVADCKPSGDEVWCLIANGQLMVDGKSPEKNFKQCDTQAMSQLFDLNVGIPLRFLQSLEQHFSTSMRIKIFVLSAQIGSISDNQLGGWYSYRNTKAALNMSLKTLAIEWRRKYKQLLLHPLHPGTTATKFTEGYVSRRKPGTVKTATETASAILDRFKQVETQVMDGFYHAQGHIIPW